MVYPYNSSLVRIMEFQISPQNTASFLNRVDGICQKYSCQYTYTIKQHSHHNHIIINFNEIKTTICDGYFKMLGEIYFYTI